MQVVDIITDVVCEYFNIPFDTLKRGRATMENVKALHIIWFFCELHTRVRPKHQRAKLREWTQYQHSVSLQTMANKFNRKSHCDVVHAVKSVANQIQTNKEYKKDVDNIGVRINQRLYPESYKNYLHYKIMSLSQ